MAGSKINPNAHKLIDEYISKAQPFAREICSKLRQIILNADHEIVEDWKWGPNYNKNGMICMYGAFKHHVHLAFFRGDAMKDSKKLFVHGEKNRHNRGIKFTDVRQVNEDVLTAYLREAVAVNEEGVELKTPAIALPPDFRKALAKDKKAKEFFESSSYTNRKEYVGWITGAKKDETRERRLKGAIQKLSRNERFS